VMEVKGIGEVASGGSAPGEDRDSEREARVRVGAGVEAEAEAEQQLWRLSE
jgi:hypothetical protein